jgi:hypothetical protein
MIAAIDNAVATLCDTLAGDCISKASGITPPQRA